MRKSRISALIFGYFAHFLAVTTVFSVTQPYLHIDPIYTFPLIACSTGIAFGLFGARQDGTTPREFALGSAIYVGFAALALSVIMGAISLKPLPLGMVLVMAIGPLFQCAFIGAGYLLWERRDRCPLMNAT